MKVTVNVGSGSAYARFNGQKFDVVEVSPAGRVSLEMPRGAGTPVKVDFNFDEVKFPSHVSRVLTHKGRVAYFRVEALGFGFARITCANVGLQIRNVQRGEEYSDFVVFKPGKQKDKALTLRWMMVLSIMNSHQKDWVPKGYFVEDLHILERDNK